VRKLKVVLPVMFALVLFACHPVPAGVKPIHYGETSPDGRIDPPTEIESWGLQGNAGDRLFVRANRTSGGVDPALEVRRQNGTTFGCANGNSGQAAIANLECVLPASETYRIRVQDSFNDEIGNYRIYVDRLNPPVKASQSIAYNQTKFAGISPAVEFEYFRFVGGAGHRVFLRASRTSGGVDPALDVRRDDGSAFGCANGNPGQAAIANLECNLPASETYLVRVQDSFNNETGNFSLFLERISSK
jgi:hypothetical protein